MSIIIQTNMFRAHAKGQITALPLQQARDFKGSVTKAYICCAFSRSALKIKKIHWRRSDKLCNKLSCRPIIDTLWNAKLFDNAMVHHNNLVPHLHSLKLVMGHVNSGCVHPVMQCP